jgi:hypothetical protein
MFYRRLIMVLVCAAALAACMTTRENPANRYKRCGAITASDAFTTDWLPARAYIDVAEDQRQRGCYPVTLIGLQGTETMLYRSAFEPQPDNIARWHYEIGIGAAQAREMDNILSVKGYTITWSDTTTSANGAVLMQIVWAKVATSSVP